MSWVCSVIYSDPQKTLPTADIDRRQTKMMKVFKVTVAKVFTVCEFSLYEK